MFDGLYQPFMVILRGWFITGLTTLNMEWPLNLRINWGDQTSWRLSNDAGIYNMDNMAFLW